MRISRSKIIIVIAIILTTLSGMIEMQAQKTISGRASYYGGRWHGRRTASGEIFNQDSLTCAHRTLPFGTKVKVVNKANGKEVIVRVTDRGPYSKSRCIDLSKEAARRIDMIAAGVASVELTVLDGKNIETAPEDKTFKLPELELLDPHSGNYYTASEWQKIQDEKKASQPSEEPRYRVLNENLTAKAGK